ncbi:hypothetical protein RIR_jg37460.t1 [Rhizophagus irregularis DAOM 181602=DAOM 197198]|nr:hypothetical protein RIR_jg37460.t1 [Rhizophagus irregularis DAOM 181602=DAOM 197198]
MRTTNFSHFTEAFSQLLVIFQSSSRYNIAASMDLSNFYVKLKYLISRYSSRISKKAVETAGEQVISKLDKTERENANLLKWIDIFSNQISSQEEEIYKLELKSYLAQSSSSLSSPPQPPSSSSSSQLSPTSFKSMDEYFKHNQVIKEI